MVEEDNRSHNVREFAKSDRLTIGAYSDCCSGGHLRLVRFVSFVHCQFMATASVRIDIFFSSPCCSTEFTESLTCADRDSIPISDDVGRGKSLTVTCHSASEIARPSIQCAKKSTHGIARPPSFVEICRYKDSSPIAEDCRLESKEWSRTSDRPRRRGSSSSSASRVAEGGEQAPCHTHTTHDTPPTSNTRLFCQRPLPCLALYRRTTTNTPAPWRNGSVVSR